MMVKPWRTRAQKAFTLVDSSAKPIRPAIAIAVSAKSRKRGCEAKKLRSKACSFEKSGGLGKTPWVNAKSRMNAPIDASKPNSTKNAAAIAEYVELGIDVLTRKSLMTSPPRAGTTLLK